MSDRPGPDDQARLAIARERVGRLSAGQLQVLRLVGEHLNSKEIAAELGISPHTVDQRIRAAIRIMGVARRQEAARLVLQVEAPYQRLIHQAPSIDSEPPADHSDVAISFQIRHADRAEEVGASRSDTEQGTGSPQPLLFLPWATRDHPRNQMSVGQRLFWILAISMGASFSAGMYLAGLESLARLFKG